MLSSDDEKANTWREYTTATESTLTPFPSLTGRKTAVEEDVVTEESISCLSLADLEAAACRHDVLLTTIFSFVWTQLLGIYTGSNDDIVFDCVLPTVCDAADPSLESPILCTSSAQEQTQLSLQDALRQYSRDIIHGHVEPSETINRAETVERRQRGGTLLDLESLVGCSQGFGLSRDARDGHSRYSITLSIKTSTTGLVLLKVSGSANVLNEEAARLLLAQYDHIIKAISRFANEPIHRLFSQYSASLQSVSNPKPNVSANSTSLQSQFEEIAKSKPLQIALEFWTGEISKLSRPSTTWTYAELDQRADHVAAELQSRFGSLVDQIVPICMDRCPELYTAILGVLKTGAAWCPIDPSFPPMRRHGLIARTGAQALIINSQSPNDGIPEGVTTLDLSRIDWSQPIEPKRNEIQPDSLAYLIWTSGTTGAPKGVPISHRAAVASMKALQTCVPTDVRQSIIRCLQFSQFTFDVFVQDLFYTWGVGGTLIAADRATMLGSFSDLATKSAATHAHLTPAFGASVSRESCPTLEVVTMIGEKLTQNVADDWSKDCRLYNTYGPAEATVVATLRLVSHDDMMLSANVGLPLPSVSAFVICNSEVVMRNGVGELALAGPQLSNGYWKDTTKTKERFIWNEDLQTTLYMTGDIVRQLYDGTFEFVGRTDDLIKIQGIRVELSEIAFALRSCHKQVQQVEVCFLKRPDRPSKVVVAFLAAPSSIACNPDTIRDERGVEVARKALKVAKTQLPDYMIPKVFLVVDAIPRTSSAKVDRGAMQRLYTDIDIRAWEQKIASTSGDGIAAADLSSCEMTVVETICSLTGTSRETLSRQSTLPSIGVDSITATRLASELHIQGIAISVAGILRCPSLADLFQCLYNGSPENAVTKFDTSQFHSNHIALLDPDLAGQVELVLPALPLQESLLSESFQNPSAYWSNTFFELNDGIDLGRLERAWKDVAKRTDALRAAFCPVADISKQVQTKATFLQLILVENPIDWTMVVASESSFEKIARNRAQEIAHRRQKRRFTEPLWAVTVFSLPFRTVLMVSIHHAIRDEPSLNILMADVEYAYMDEHERPLPQSHQLRDSISLLYPANVEQVEQDEQFWSDSLSALSDGDDSRSWPELKLADDGRIEGTVTHCWHADDSYKNLRHRSASIGAASLAAVLRVVWGCILLEYLETDKVVFGETWSARGEAPELSDAVAPLVFVLPVPFRAGNSWRETLQSTTNTLQQSQGHYGVHPLSIRKMLGRAEGEALYPAIFNFVPESTEHNSSGQSLMWRKIEDIVELSVEHAIAFNAVIANNDTLSFELTALRRYMDMEHLHLLASQIDGLLKIMLDNPDGECTQLSTHMPSNLLSFVSSEEKPANNLTKVQSPTHWVDCSAALHPTWIAAEVVSSLDETKVISSKWSYEQLQTAYRHVASLINESGYRKRMIAVCLDRRLELYAAVLGITSTGNTYLPIADDLPEERKLFLLQDSDAAMLLTTRLLATTFSSTRHTVFVEDLDYSKPIQISPEARPQATDDAYLLYTSGSTGAPKGVLVSRGNLMSFIEAITHFISPHVNMTSLQGKGKWLGMASYAFDVHLLEMFFAWRHGTATVTGPRSLLLDNLELALQKLEVTHASFVPSLVDNAGLNPANLPNLRYMSLGGEKISKKAITTWSKSHVVLANAYGPTEATIGCCFRRVEPSSNVRNIGFPLSYTTAHVLRPGSFDYVLRGTPGELCLTGDLVATGYLNRPDAKGFVEDFHGKRMYRTGDRVRLMADGSLEFLGRDDDQTKIRGQRIELGEVSEAVRSAASKSLGTGSIEVTSLVVQHQALNRPQLVAFIATPNASRNNTSKSDPTVGAFAGDETAEQIRLHCRNVLPSFMVPDHLIRLTYLPLVPTSRKVDAKKLRMMFSDIPLNELMSNNGLPTPGAHTLNNAETTVRDQVAQVLAVDPKLLSPNSNLFRFGLDSLSVISLTINLQKQGFDCSVSQILRNPSIRAIAGCASPAKANGEASNASSRIADLERRFRGKSSNGINLANIAAVRACLPLQETLVASSVDHEGEALYVNHVLFELSPDVDHQKLLHACAQTAERHEILRTCFYEFEHHFIQIVLKDSPLSCDRVRTDAMDDVLTDLRQRQSEIAFEIIANIEKSPPIKLTLATSRLVHEKAMLLVSLHHALYDQESFTLLLDEVYALYQGLEPVKRHTPVTKLMEHIDSRNRSQAEAFWTRYLSHYKPPASLDPATDNQTMSTSVETATPLADLENLAASLNGTTASLMQALFGIVLAETLQTDDVVFGTVLSGRTVPFEGAQSIVAPCITTIPQRVNIDSASPLRDIIQSAQKGFAESIEYQHTALKDIHRWVKAKNPLLDTLFTYTRKASEAQWSHLWREVESTMSSGFPLAVEIVAGQASNPVSVRCDFTAAFGNLAKANVLVGRLAELLQTLVLGKDANLKVPSGQKSEKRSPIITNGDHWTKEEALMRDIISDMVALDAQSITRGTTFFVLGLDSIIAIQFAKRLRQRDIQCSSADVMRYPSIAALGQYIASKRISRTERSGSISRLQASTNSPDRPVDGIPKTYPCTPLQSSMLTQTMGSDESLYVHYHAIRFAQGHDASTLRKAWKMIVAGTEILRTSFQFSEGSNAWSGVVYEQAEMIWNEHDPSLDLGHVMQLIKQQIVFKQETDFARPPWRVDITGDVFILSLHHSLYDGESIRLLLHDFWTASKRNLLPERPSFSQAAEEIQKGNSVAEDYWMQTLDKFRGTPTHSEHGPMKEVRATLALDPNAVLQGCRRLGVTFQSVALIAFGKTIASLSKSQDIAFGHVVSGRSLPALNADEIIGPLFNTVPVRLDLGFTASTNRDAIQRIQRMTGESQIYQHASLSNIQQAWRKEIVNPDAELLDSLFVFQKRSIREAESWETVTVEDDVAPTEYATNFECEQTDTGINISVNSRSIEDLPSVINTFKRMLCDILDNPDTAVTAILEDLPPSDRTVPDQSERSKLPDVPGLEVTTDRLETIRRLLAKVSGVPVDNISDDASIFSLGLDSISAIQISATARKEGVKLSVADVLQGRTLRGICQRLAVSQDEKTISNGGTEHPTTPNPPPHLLSTTTKSKALSLASLPSTAIEAILPCLPGQTYHLLTWLASGRTLGEGTFTYTCHTRLSPAHLLEAWRALRHRHSILRTVFAAPSPTEAVQMILKPDVTRSDCFQCVEYESPETIRGIVQQVASRRFDLFSPPVELTLARSSTGEGDDHIILKLHHALYDAYTIPILLADLNALYTHTPLPPLPSSSAAHITALLPSPATTGLAQEYWRRSLSNCSPTILSSPSQQPTAAGFTTATHTIPHLTHLARASRNLNTTLPTLLLLSHARVLARHTSVPNPTFGVFQTGRSSSSSSLSETSKSSMPCLNILPLSVPAARTLPTSTCIENLQADLAARVPFEQSSLREILQHIGQAKEKEKPLFNTYVNILWDSDVGAYGQHNHPQQRGEKKSPLFEAWQSRSDEQEILAPRMRTPGRTGVDGLDTGVLAEKCLFVDIERCGDELRIMGRCDTGVFGGEGEGEKEKVRGFLEEIAEEVRKLVEGELGEGNGEI
ncbi:MAG: hypothetical protein Q9208_001515 [Pyrenodesmia sp. 3 TL-2023]